MRIILISTPLILAFLTACTAKEASDTLSRTVEGIARGACEAAGNCRNICPDGTTAHGPGYHCP